MPGVPGLGNSVRVRREVREEAQEREAECWPLCMAVWRLGGQQGQPTRMMSTVVVTNAGSAVGCRKVWSNKTVLIGRKSVSAVSTSAEKTMEGASH